MPRNRNMSICSSESSASRDMRSAWPPALPRVSARAGLGLAQRSTGGHGHTDAGVMQRPGAAGTGAHVVARHDMPGFVAEHRGHLVPRVQQVQQAGEHNDLRGPSPVCSAHATISWPPELAQVAYAGPARLAPHLAAGEHERIHRFAPDDCILPLQALRSAHAACAVLCMTGIACKQHCVPHLEVLLVAAAAPVCSTCAVQERIPPNMAQACGMASTRGWPMNTSGGPGKHL